MTESVIAFWCLSEQAQRGNIPLSQTLDNIHIKAFILRHPQYYTVFKERQLKRICEVYLKAVYVIFVGCQLMKFTSYGIIDMAYLYNLPSPIVWFPYEE